MSHPKKQKAPAGDERPIVFKGGGFVAGVPALDLTLEMWALVPVEVQRVVVSSGLYDVPAELQPEPQGAGEVGEDAAAEKAGGAE